MTNGRILQHFNSSPPPGHWVSLCPQLRTGRHYVGVSINLASPTAICSVFLQQLINEIRHTFQSRCCYHSYTLGFNATTVGTDSALPNYLLLMILAFLMGFPLWSVCTLQFLLEFSFPSLSDFSQHNFSRIINSLAFLYRIIVIYRFIFHLVNSFVRCIILI